MAIRKHILRGISHLHAYHISSGFLSRTQFWPEEKRDAYILARLRSVLIEAKEDVEYYRDLFLRIGFDPRFDLKDLSDLSLLPVLTKEDVRNNRAKMVSRRHGYRSMNAETSGTTGQPLQMVVDESHLAFDAACVLRHQAWAG